MKEAELQTWVIDLAHAYNWRVAHFRSIKTFRGFYQTPVAADGAGFPDLILVRDRLIAVELKVGYHKLSAEQAKWILAFNEAGVQAFLWTEKDWANGSILGVLSRPPAPSAESR